MSETTTTPKSTALVPDPREVAQIATRIDVRDRAAISAFGEGAQRSAADYSDRVLEQLRNKDIGETGELLTQILVKSKGLDPAALKEGNFIERMFVSAQTRVERFRAKFDDVSSQIDRVAIELDAHKDKLRRDIAILDDLYDRTKVSILNLETHIAAGKSVVEELRQKHLPALKEQADAGNSLVAQEYSDFLQAIERLEKRISYLQQAMMLSIQQLPQIRIVQAGNDTLIENLQTTAALTIPAWKQKMVILLGLTRQREALDLQRTVTDATNQMIRDSSRMMNEQAIAIEEQSQRGIVDIETLKQANEELISTVQKVVQIQRDGRAKRADAEQQMQQMTLDLKKALVD